MDVFGDIGQNSLGGCVDLVPKVSPDYGLCKLLEPTDKSLDTWRPRRRFEDAVQ